MKKRIIAVILCALLAVTGSFAGCQSDKTDSGQDNSDTGNKTQGTKQAEIILPYSSSDSLNPFFATGNENTALAFLFCQPLFEVKSNYSPEAVLADAYSVDGTTVTVGLKSVMFSDGSTVSAKDVVYSFEKAKSSPAYSQRLLNVQSAKVVSGSVVFTLASPDCLVLNILTFPVVKSSTADKTDSIVTGSGVFMLSGGNTMPQNPHSQISSTISSVTLYDVKNPEYVTNELEIGNINYLFEDFSDGAYKRIVAENKTVVLNNLVYLGMNSTNPALSSAAVRTAVYYAIDKENVSASAYQGYSKATSTPFNPDFYQLAGVNAPSTAADTDKCESILEKLGYNRYTKTGARTNGIYSLEFSILVNSENAFRTAAATKIADALADRGIKVKVDAVSSAVYQQRITAGDFQMYLGEVKLTENMDLSAFASGQPGVGIDKASQFFVDYTAFRAGTIGTQALIDSFLDDMVFVPICYRAGMAAYSKTFTPDFSYAPFNIYGNIENWEIK